MPSPVRMHDIAARAGVSVATVSLALRNNQLVSAATRARIHALADRMGYRMHPYVSAYMSWRRSRGSLRLPTIALLHSYAAADDWRQSGSGNLREMHRGVIEQIRARGYGIEELWLQSARPRRLAEILKARGVSGLVFAPIAQETVRYDLPWGDFSAVQIGTGPAGLNLPRVVHDHYQSALGAVRRCAVRGYRRPGLVIDRAHDDRLQHVWRAGFEMGVEEFGFGRDRMLRIDERRPDLPVLRKWLKRQRPDVIVTNLHEVLEKLLRELGLAAPRDVGLVSLSVPALGHRVTGVDQNSHLIGMQAVDVLTGALQLHRTGLLTETITTLVAGRWNPGETF